jgi:hypothetical protein
MRTDRKYERKTVVVRGWITGLGETLSPCLIDDMSTGGAKLILSKSQPPDKFRLYFSPHAGTFRNCTVRWRKSDSIGVQFAGTASGVVDKFI